MKDVKPRLKPGDTVRVVGERGTAKVRAILTSMHGALLEKQIDGLRRLMARAIHKDIEGQVPNDFQLCRVHTSARQQVDVLRNVL